MDWGHNNSGAQVSSNSSHQSRKPPGIEGKYMRCGNRNTIWVKGFLPRMQSEKTAIKLDISTRYARARKELNRELNLFKLPRMMMTPTLMKMKSDNQNHHQG